MSDPSPTYLAMSLRRQWSDEHVFEPSPLRSGCDRCGRRFGHPDHVDRQADKNAVLAMKDRIGA